jgi:thioredoxin reductase
MTVPRLDPKSIAGKSPSVERRAELVVVGAGPAGCAAAIAASRAGVQVLLIDENPVAGPTMGLDVPLHYGQRMSSAVHNKPRMVEQLVATNPDLAEAFELGVEVELGLAVWGGFVNSAGVRSLPGPLLGVADETRSWLIGFDRLIVASGARDLAIAFPGWETPGVMGANAVHALLTRYDAFGGRRMAVLGSGALGLATALLALDRGVDVAAVIEVAAAPQGPQNLIAALRERGVPLLVGHAIKAASGGVDGVEAITIVGLDGDLAALPGSEGTIVCDTVCLAIGAVPNIELLATLGCALVSSPERGGHVPVLDAAMRTSLPLVFAAGDCAGVFDGKVLDAAVARAEGSIAGRAAASSLGKAGEADNTNFSRPSPLEGEVRVGGRRGEHHDSCGAPDDDTAQVAASAPSRQRNGVADLPLKGGGDDEDVREPPRDAHLYQTAWLRALINTGGWDVHACQCEEVSRREIVEVRPPRYLGWGSSQMPARGLDALAADGPLNQDQVKRLTRAGMGLCQGRRCREQIALLLALTAKLPVGAIPLASYRPPLRPLPLGVLRPTDEPPAMRRDWDVWFGIPTQWTPFWEIDSEDGGAAGASGK